MPRRKLILALLFLVVAGTAVLQVLPRPARDPFGQAPGPDNPILHQGPFQSNLPPWAQGAQDGSGNPLRKQDDARTTSSVTSCPEVEVELAEIRASPLFNTSSKLADMVLYGKFPELSADQLDRYLAENQRSPLSLLVASHLMKNPALLEEAAAAAPLDPLIQLELAWSTHDLPGKSSAIQALARADPGNALKHFLQARWQLDQGDRQGALKTLDLASESPYTVDSYAKRMTDAIALAYQSSGLSEPEAYFAALSQTNERPHAVLSVFAGVVHGLKAKESTAVDEQFDSTVWLILATAAPSIKNYGQTVDYEVIANGLESWVLQELPGDTPVDMNGKTASSRLEELEYEKGDLYFGLLDSRRWIRTMDEKLLANYLRVFKASGEREAQRWLNESEAKLPPP